MPRATSKTKVDKLGDRLRRSSSIALEDLELFQAIRTEYFSVLTQAQQNLTHLGLDPTPRLKTINTTIEKLRREHNRLSQIQDLAGLRIVRDMRLSEQDHLVEIVRSNFDDARVVDRRAVPSNGYRAVHVVLNIDDYPVEVQIRTFLQHRWAEIFEERADEWGRQVRYGEPPDDAEAPGLLGTRQQTIEALRDLSAGIATLEQDQDTFDWLGRSLQEAVNSEGSLVAGRLAEDIEESQRSMDSLETLIRLLLDHPRWGRP